MSRKRQKLWPGLAPASSLIACPICSRQVPLPLINSHLDTGCTLSGPLAPPVQRPASKTPAWRSSDTPASHGCKSAESPLQQPSTCPAAPDATDPPETESGSPVSPPAAPYKLTLYHPTGSQLRVPEVMTLPILSPLQQEDISEQAGGADPAAEQSREHHRQPSPTQPSGEGTCAEDEGAAAAQQHRQALQDPSSRQMLLRRLTAGGHSGLPGHHTIPSFVSPAEEASLIALLDTCQPAWQDSNFNGRHRGKAWGVRMDVRTRKVLPAKVELPELLQRLAARMRQDVPALRKFYPSEANAIDYHRKTGHELQAHVDDRQLSTGEIVTLSLLGACTMTFQTDGKKGAKQTVRVRLPPRTLQVLTGKARYSFSHAIHLADLEDERRVSITFRQSPLT